MKYLPVNATEGQTHGQSMIFQIEENTFSNMLTSAGESIEIPASGTIIIAEGLRGEGRKSMKTAGINFDDGGIVFGPATYRELNQDIESSINSRNLLLPR